MRNPINTSPAIRWQLLSTVSAAALLATVYGGEARATDADTGRPLIWIELGGEMAHSSGQGQIFSPDFLTAFTTSDVLKNVTPVQAQRLPGFGFGEDGKISFQPENSDWVFSAAIRYGRSRTSREVDHQTKGIFYISYKSGKPKYNQNPRGIEKFSDTKVDNGERHAIVDFSAGKDIGLGIFGGNTSSTLSLGVRFAQFRSGETFDIRARPDLEFDNLTFGSAQLHLPYFHTYHATGNASRNFRGVGPSVSWSGSTPFVGNTQDGELTIDWGANAALLFGRQRARVRHQETGRYVNFGFVINGQYYTAYRNPPTGHDTNRNVTVPNIGGSIGLSWRLHDFKVSFGYRADLFMNAMDTGIDKRNSSNLLFHGPYASISVGLGD